MQRSREEKHHTEVKPVSTKSRHILLLDDEKAVRDALTRLLKACGHYCSTAPTGEILLDLLEHSRQTDMHYDLAILDIKIVGGMGGIETMQRILQIDCSISVISMSGYPVETLLDEADSNGFVGHLEKPFSGKQLSAEIERVCSLSSPTEA